MTAWVIRAGASGENEAWNLEQGRAGVSFRETPDLTACTTREAVREVVDASYPGDAPGRRANFAGQLWALRNTITPGDLIVMPLKSKPGYLAMGRCTTEYAYDAAQSDKTRRHHIGVQWKADPVPRSALKDDLLNTVNGAMTVFTLSRNNAAARLEAVYKNGADPGYNGVTTSTPTAMNGQVGDAVTSTVTDPETVPTLEALRDRVRTHIVENFSGHKLTSLVADILTVRGFVCDVSPAGPDTGVDIIAGRGPLGLDDPTIVVEVKSEPTQVSASVVRSLHSAVTKNGAKQGLLVAWGGVTPQARKEFAQQRTLIRIWDAEDVLNNLFDVYPQLPETTKARIPLKQAWVLDDEPGL